MAYRVEISCDEHFGNDCSNHGPFQPGGSGDNAQQAARRAEGDARHKGWIRAKGYRWACPACKVVLLQRARMASSVAHFRKKSAPGSRGEQIGA